MDYQLIKANQFVKSPWSGGDTTEFVIYPKTAKYEFRDFSFRLSTATVEVEESTFTSLPGITRTLMVLEGEMMLSHESHHIKKLGRFDSDYFKGDWKTKSKGKCTDFNLMTMGDTHGTVESLFIKKDQIYDFSFSEIVKHLVIYTYSGQFMIDDAIIETGDVIVVENPNGSFEIQGVEKCDLIITKIF